MSGLTLRIDELNGSLVLLIVLPMILFGLGRIPRPVPPAGIPYLELAPRSIDAVIKRERKLSAQLVASNETKELGTLYEQAGRNEALHQETHASVEHRLRQIKENLKRLVDQRGALVIAELRANAMLNIEPVILGKVSPEERAARLGGLPDSLNRYGVTRHGELVAPLFVARCLAKARWNVVFGRIPTEGFSAVERRAYWGWIAHSSRLPSDARFTALRAYQRAGGLRVLEMRAAILAETGELESASQAYIEASKVALSWRLRNHAYALMNQATQ